MHKCQPDAPPLWQQVYDRAIANGSSSDQIEQILDMLQEQMLFA